MINFRTVQEEEEITKKLTSLQEEVGDDTLLEDTEEMVVDGETAGGQVQNDKALKEHALALSRVLEEADVCRLKTVKDLLNILTPLQAVDFLVAAKKLYLSMHEWGHRKYMEHGRFCLNN